MPVTATPVFAQAVNFGKVAITAANTKSDGSGTVATDIFLLATAGANGSFFEDVRFSFGASSAATATTATVGRVYIASTNTGALTAGTNSWLLGEVYMPSQTADSTNAATTAFSVPIYRKIPSGLYILVSTHHAPAANTSVHATLSGEDF